jgi:hypothetical protein
MDPKIEYSTEEDMLMRKVGTFVFSCAIFATLLLAQRPASGSCIQLQEGSIRCGDSCGSIGVYVCSFGCAWGFCTTGYGVCCGVRYQSNGIAPEPDPEKCPACGLARTHSPSSIRSAEPSSIPPGARVDPQIYSTDDPTRLQSLPDQLLYVPDKCAHTYERVDLTVFSSRSGGS